MLSRLSKPRVDHDLVGLDIGSCSIKLMSINSSEKPFQVKKYAAIDLPPDTIVKGEIKDYRALGEVLNNLFKEQRIQTKSVALAIPRSSVIIKNILIDARLNANEIETRAWIEANHHFPDLVGEVYLDFTIAAAEQDPTQLDLTLVACRKDQINPYLEALAAGGLKASIIDVNSFALERSLNLIQPTSENLKTVALLNLDTTISTLLIVHENKLIYAHDHNYDGQRLQNQVEAYLKTAVNGTASLSDASYAETLKAALSAHLRHTLHFFYSSRPNITIQKLIISGECSRIPYLAAFIQQEAGMETVLANPLEHLSIAPELDTKALQESASMLMLCCGLALSTEKSLNEPIPSQLR